MATENKVNIADTHFLKDNPEVINYEKELSALRLEGETKIKLLRDEIDAVKTNKVLDKETKRKTILDLKAQLADAKKVKKENKPAIKATVKEAIALVNSISKEKYNYVCTKENDIVKGAKAKHKVIVADLKKEHSENVSSINAKYNDLIANEADSEKVKQLKDEAKYELNSEKLAYKTKLYEEKLTFGKIVQNGKDHKYNVFQDINSERNVIRGGKNSILEKTEARWKNYVYTFTLPKFLLNNSLYLVIVFFFIIAAIVAPLSGKGMLFSLDNFMTIFEQSSTRMFYALGVAGLILLAGTDLSVGRMVALGSVFTSVILHDGVNIVKFFGMDPWNFDGLPMWFRVILALLVSCCLTTLFSAIAGFFSAKFKMHPFVTTLSTQLIIYGALYYGTSGVSTGTMNDEIKDFIGGRISIGNFEFPKLIIFAIVAIIVAWFIWNKTKFGKNMYAVGGNAEAASVSGISVFWTTLCVFIMAGIFYGCGSFLEAFKANASAGTGQGFELDAIAACVVGGISFSGGVGKIRGAVIGVIIFTGLTYVLGFLGIDTNLQFVFKGIIIMAAVALDSAKYLKKK